MDMHRAAADCDLAAIQRLLAEGADVNAIGVLEDWDDDEVDEQDEFEDDDADDENEEDDEDDFYNEVGLFDEEESDILERGEKSTPLLMAIDSEANDQQVVTVVELLLSAGAKVNLPDECGRTPLMAAAFVPRLAVVRQLLAAGATVHAKSKSGATALHWSLSEDDDRRMLISVVRELTAQGADPGKRDQHGRTPLMLAARLGLADLVRDWIGQGLDPEATDNGDRNTLSYAFRSLAAISRNQEPRYDSSEVAEGLAQLGLDPDSELARQALQSYTQPPTDATPLELMMSGAESGQEFEAARRKAVGALNETVELLLEQGCSLESSSPYLAKAGRTDLLKRVSHLALDAINPETGETALTEAVAEGQVERVRQLLDAGADPNAPNYIMAMTPLMCMPSSRRGFECGRLLVAAGADLNLVNEHGLTAIDEALLSCDTDKIPFLLKVGVDPRQGIPLLWALARELPAELNLLLDHGADPNARLGVDRAHHFPEYLQGTTAFMRACADQPVEVLQKMLDAGADLAATDREGQTCIGIAQRFGRPEVAQWLHDEGAPSPGQQGLGAVLLDAAEQGHAEIVADCLAQGADPGYAGEREYTPLVVASREGHTAIVESLIAAGADVHAGTDYGLTPLRAAVSKGHTTVVRLLIAAGAEPGPVHDFVCTKGISCSWGTALHDASRIGAAEIVGILLAAGAELNAVDQYGWTPLVVAISDQRWETAQQLLAAGAERREEDIAYWRQLEFPDNAAQPVFAESIARMETLCGTQAEPASVPGVVVLSVPPDTPRPEGTWADSWKEQQAWSDQHMAKIWRLLDDAYSDCLNRGHLVIQANQITLLPTTDKFAVLTLFNIGTNEDPEDTPQIVNGLRELDRMCPFHLRGCGRRRVILEFIEPPADSSELARRLRKIYWGLAHPYENPASLARAIETESRLNLWWDD